MADLDGLARDIAARQVTMFAMFVGQGRFATRAALSRASGIPESTLKDYASGTAMNLATVLHLRRFLPAEAINMLSEPGDARIVDTEASDTNWDEIASSAAQLVGDICDARKDGKIDHVEDRHLRQRARALIAEAQSAVEAG